MGNYKHKAVIYTIVAILFLFSCCKKPGQTAIKFNNHPAIDSTISLIRTGDIVLRRGRGPDSYILAHMNLKDPSWSHCGIVVIENGYPFVYHSIGGEDNPDERLRRDSVGFFFSPMNNYGVAVVRYNFKPDNIAQLIKTVHQYYAIRPKFDMQFDLNTDDKLYCSEFVYKSVLQATHDSGYIKTSMGHGRRFVGIDDLFLNEHAMFVAKVNYK